MRLVLALVVVVVLAAGSAAVAGGAVRTPPKLVFHVVHLAKPHPARRPASCSARTRTGKHVAKVAKRILPVACEQPPRSRLGLDLARAAAAAASALVT